METQSFPISNLIAHPVRVDLHPGSSGCSYLVGNLYTVDPVTQDVVILVFQDSRPSKMHWIPNTSIKSVTRVENNVAECVPFSKDIEDMMSNLFRQALVKNCDTGKRKQDMIAWLKRNHVEVKSQGEALIIFGCVRVEAPFQPDDCYCDNPIVLKRVRAMIEKCPKPEAC